MKNIQDIISNLTLKASYSLVADRGPAWITNSRVVINSFTPWRPTTGNKESGLQISDIENRELTYEKKHEFNVGLSVGLLNNRINIEADWYKRNNFDLIGSIATQGTGGVIVKYGNVASMKSNGFEVSLSTQNIRTKNFSWKTDFIYSHVNNKISKLQGSARLLDMVIGSGFAKEGYAVRSIFSIPFEGLNNEGLPTFRNEFGEVTSTGINFQARDTGKGELDFLKYEGPADPTDMGSLGNNFSYKGFKLNVFITYSWGNVVRLDPVFKYAYSDLSAMTKEFNNRWAQAGDENSTTIPVIASLRQAKADSKLSYAYNAYNYSTERIAKGDFIRMKEISLSYDLPKQWFAGTKLNSISLKLQATNLFLIYADKKLNGQDPEFFNTGGVAAPVPKQFTFSVRIGL